MTEFSAVSLRIETVGADRAFQSLEALDAKGRKIVESVAGYTGRAMGDVAAAYERAGAKGQDAFRAVAAQAQLSVERTMAVARETEELGKASDRLAMRQAHAAASASRGLEMLGRTGRLTGRSLDAVLGQAAAVAFSFGPAGQVVAAIAISTAAIVEMFMRTSKEAKKLAAETAKEIESIYNTGTYAGAAERVSTLYSGNPFAADPLDRGGIAGLQKRKAELQALLKGATDADKGGTTYDALGNVTSSAVSNTALWADELAKVTEHLGKTKSLYDELTKKGGVMDALAQKNAASDLPGFITDQLSAQERASKEAMKAAQKAHDRAIEAFSDGVEQRKKERDAAVAAEVARLTDANDPNISLNANLDRALNKQMGTFLSSTLGAFDPKAMHEQFKAGRFELDEMVLESIKNDPFLKTQAEFKKAVKELAKHMHDELSRTLGQSISAGFEAAFSGKGITGAFEAFTATVLAGLGGFMEQLGGQMIVIGLALDALATSLLTLNGPGAIAAGVALVAAGAGLRAIAGSFGKSGTSAAGSGGTASSAGSNAVAAPSFLSFGVGALQTPTTSASVPDRAPSMNFTIIGNDPGVQRDIARIVNSATGRGLIPATR